MWIVELEDQGFTHYILYRHKPIVKQEYPTERTCRSFVVNEDEAGYIGLVDYGFVRELSFTLFESEPVEIEITKVENDEHI